MKLLAVFIIPVYLLLAACAQPAPQEPADLVINDAVIYTLNPDTPVAEAVAVRDGRIIAVGHEDDMAGHINDETRVISLAGKVVYPGFTDSHVHLLGVGARELTLSLEGTTGLDDFLQRVERRAREAADGEWILGRGWIETFWQPPVFPTRQDLDRIAPDNPVFLVRADGHGAVANSKALEIAGITAASEDPFGGEIMRDADGEPSGMLLDKAQALIRAHIPPNFGVDMRRALIVGADRSARMGWTQLQIAGNDYQEADLIRELIASGDIGIRIYNAIRGPSEDASRLLAEGPVMDEHDGLFTMRTIKISVDGALGSKGAALLEPYNDHGTRGLLTWREADLMPLYKEALKKGIQLETHAIGDRANRFVLDLYENAFSAVPPAERGVQSPRWRIEHAQVLHKDDIPRFAALDVIPSMQASHAIGDLHFAPIRLGIERLAGAYVWRTLVDSGAVIPGGSDAPVEAGDPLIEFYAAAARKDLSGFSGEGWHPEEALTREEALKTLTLWPAYAAFQEDVRGSIEVGKYADFTVVSADIMKIPEAEIPRAEILMTIVGGRVVFEK
ncbi:MAG: amidohydrolase [Gammaproteobacteria bacterium]|nr:amidohydrolase [Gammaproteobacteria bacterium]